jgi:hypothetical protein
LIAAPAIGIWGWRRFSIGTVELNQDCLIVKTKAHTQTYPWEDIEGITVSTFEQSAGWLGLHMKRPAALVQLRHQYRDSLVRDRSGTRTQGPSIPRGVKVLIEPDDVHGFVEEANRYLEAAHLTTARSR